MNRLAIYTIFKHSGFIPGYMAWERGYNPIPTVKNTELPLKILFPLHVQFMLF